jgi:hypothetical protein
MATVREELAQARCCLRSLLAKARTQRVRGVGAGGTRVLLHVSGQACATTSRAMHGSAVARQPPLPATHHPPPRHAPRCAPLRSFSP